MRDTLILGAVLAGIVFGFYHYRKNASLEAPLSSREAVQLNDSHRSHPLRDRNPGDHYEGSINQQNFETEVTRSDEGTSGEAAQVANLPSIYSQPSEAKQPNVRVAKPGKRPAIGGFDTDSYVATRNNRLKHAQVVAPTDQGVRVFLMCMELHRDSVESKSVSDCRSLYRDNVAMSLTRK